MLKKELRLKYAKLREEIPSESLSNLSLSIANKLLALPIWHKNYYHIFLSIKAKKEIDTSFILSILQGKDKHIILPKIIENNQLEHILLTDNTKLVVNSWGVPEPVDGIMIPPTTLDVIFIPLLAFDVFGNRVGYGKGFYDMFLKNCKPDSIKVGLSIFPPEDKITDCTTDDIPLDYCVTPENIYSFSDT